MDFLKNGFYKGIFKLFGKLPFLKDLIREENGFGKILENLGGNTMTTQSVCVL